MKSTRRKTKKTITKNMILGEVTRLYPNSIEIMLEHGLHYHRRRYENPWAIQKRRR